MVERTVQEQFVREAPEIEAYKIGLLQAGKAIADKPIDLPDQKVAGFDPAEQEAYDYVSREALGPKLRMMPGPIYRSDDRATTLGTPGGMVMPPPDSDFGDKDIRPYPDGVYGYGGIGGYESIARAGRGTLQRGLGTLDRAQGQLGRAEEQTMLGAGQFQGGPGYYAQGFRGGAPFLGMRQFQGGPGYTAGQFGGGPGYTAGQFGGGPGYGAAGFDPASASQYMNPYEDTVVQQALSDIQRQGDIAQTQADAQAVGAGAFGGSRQGIQRAEMGRNLLDTQARTAAGLRSSGYQQAMAQAQQAFMDQQRRAQAEAQFRTQSGQQAFEDQQRRAQAQAQFGTQSQQQAFEDQQRRAQAQAQFGTQSQQQAFEDAQRRRQAGGQFATSTAQQAFEDQQRRAQAEAQFRTQSGQQAFEAAKQRQMGIGQGIASLGGQMAGIGTQQAGIGGQQLGAAQQMQSTKLRDLGLLQQMGQQRRGIAQAQSEADYQNQLKQLYEPYGRISWLGDIYKGAPSSQSVLGSTLAPSPPSPSMFQQIAGLGTGLLGTAAAAKSIGGLF